jgi:hypothetical protein
MSLRLALPSTPRQRGDLMSPPSRRRGEAVRAKARSELALICRNQGGFVEPGCAPLLYLELELYFSQRVAWKRFIAVQKALVSWAAGL